MKKELHVLFRRHRVLELEELQRHVGGRSRRSLYRDLQAIDSYSSYSHSGKYHTTKEVARFDQQGLWHYGDIGFSRHGSLRSTIVNLVEESDAGYSYGELKGYFVVRIENALRELTNEGLICREGERRSYLYVSSDKTRASQQRNERSSKYETSKASINLELIIEVLAESLRGSRLCVELEELTERLVKRGVNVSMRQVAQVLELYGVKKTLVSK